MLFPLGFDYIERDHSPEMTKVKNMLICWKGYSLIINVGNIAESLKQKLFSNLFSIW